MYHCLRILGLATLLLSYGQDQTVTGRSEAANATPTAPALAIHPMEETLEGPVSLYTASILQTIRDWPAGKQFCHPETGPLGIHTVGIRTKDRPYYVGFKKCVLIKAPLASVATILDDIEHYAQLFPGAAAVRLVNRDGNRLVLEWERKIPIFFVPNIKYEISYLSQTASPDLRTYRYQFRRGDKLRFSDGAQFLESVPGQEGPETLLTNYEFYEADYGIGIFGINAVGSDTVWRESLKGSYLTLLSLRYKAEHPDWDYARIEKESEEALKGISLEALSYQEDPPPAQISGVRELGSVDHGK